MKRSFILLLSLLTVCSLFAQSADSRLPVAKMHKQVLNALLQQQDHSTQAAMRTTSGISMERVITQTTRDNIAGALNDSLSIRYTGGRGSTYDYNTMIYAYNYPYNTSPMFNYAGIFTAPQVLCDTLLHWTVDPNTLIYGYYETDLSGYDVDENLSGYRALHADSAFYPNMICANTFPVGHMITTGYSSNFVLGVADSAFKQYFSYNAAHLLTQDSTYELHLGTWRLASKTYYTYDGSNNLIAIDNYANTIDTSFLLPLVEHLQYLNTYDASHRLLTVAANYHYTAGLSPYTRDTFAYTGTHTFHTAWREYQYDTINSYWAPMFNMTKALNVSGNPDTVNIQSFDSIMNAWVPQTMDIVHYDAAGNPDTLKDYEYNFTSWPATPNFTTAYRYQTYLNTQGVAQQVIEDNTKIYPNPATNTFTISGLGVPANTPITVTMMNVSGQMVSRETRYWQGDTQVSVNDLMPGIYWVVIQDNAGNILHRQSVVKP